MIKQTATYKKSIYKLIAKRLSWASLLIAALFSLGSFYHSRQMIYNAVVHVSSAQLTFIKGELLESMKTQPETDIISALQAAISYPPGN
ncbi:hypothetical protein [Desulfopila sp. IMCC35008]|uniref:hypothetical protein n=1 Tax=Desulfopila sp. IMCC35008 TaxID=2653858 RepID=UPI0013D17EBC|nr:hypothetical protein [Desulfopila sp. IMCC35008]